MFTYTHASSYTHATHSCQCSLSRCNEMLFYGSFLPNQTVIKPMKMQVNVQDACLIKNENEGLSINLCSIQLSARFVKQLYLSVPFNLKNKKSKKKKSINLNLTHPKFILPYGMVTSTCRRNVGIVQKIP